MTLELEILTKVYDRLLETQKMMDAASTQIAEEFDVDKTTFFSNPIGYTCSLHDPIKAARASFTNFVVWQLNKEYKNLIINDEEMRAYSKEHGFNAATLIQIIREKYADEDGITLQQIQTTLNPMIPRRSGEWEYAKTPEGIPKIRDTGFELLIHGYESEKIDKAAAFLKLVDIVLRGIKPSEVDTKRVKIGEVYKDDRIKSLRYFKNGAFKAIFHTVEDCESIKAALFEK